MVERRTASAGSKAAGSFRLMGVVAMTVAVVGLAGTAPAATVLTGGRGATLTNKPGGERDQAKLVFGRDPALSLVDPLCGSGNETTLTLGSSAADHREIVLPCANWTAKGSGFAYRDRDALHGGVYEVRFRSGELQVQLKGATYAAVVGPVAGVELGFRIGAADYCGRFSTFRRNDATKITAKGPTTACETGATTPTSTPVSATPMATSTPVPGTPVSTVTPPPGSTPTSTRTPAGDLLGSSRGGSALWDFCEDKPDDATLPADPRSLVQPGVNEDAAVHFNIWWRNCHEDPEAVQEVGTPEDCGELRARFYRGDLLLDTGSHGVAGLFTGTDPDSNQRSSTFTAAMFNQVWQVWGGYQTRPDNFDELVAERYGSAFGTNPNPYPLPGEDPNLTNGGSGRLPEMFTQLRDGAYGAWSGEITVTCHACHSGSVGTTGELGPGMTWGGGSSLADLNLFLRDFLALGYEASAAVVLNLNRTRGRNNASLINLAFAAAGIQGFDVLLGILTSGSTADMDTPAWWNMGHRPVKFVDGVFPMDAPRVDAIFYAPSIGITPQGQEWMRVNGPDLNAWIEGLKAPAYPFPVDTLLAEEGAELFHTLDMWAPERNNPIPRPEGNGSCASCHGAYAPRYVNDPAFLDTPALEGIASYVVPMDIIGTDPERLAANNDAVQEAGTTSFFGYPESPQYCGPQNHPDHRGDREPGYLAPPLYGVWASSPYFHNGSVPNVWEVLQPADRQQIWRRVSKPVPLAQQGCLGCSVITGYDTDLERAFDTQKLGWRYDAIPCEVESASNPSVTPYVNCNPSPEDQEDPLTEQILAQFYAGVLLGWNLIAVPPLTDVQMQDRKNFNTRMFAQGNEGHEFNAVLTDAERTAIIEYLKTL